MPLTNAERINHTATINNPDMDDISRLNAFEALKADADESGENGFEELSSTENIKAGLQQRQGGQV